MEQFVWVICSESVCDGEFKATTSVFSTYEKAKEEFDKLVEEEKNNDYLIECDDVVISESEAEFTIYEDSCYSEDYYSVWIAKKKVN